MAQITIEIPDDLVQRLAPLQGQLSDLFVRLAELVLLQQVGLGPELGPAEVEESGFRAETEALEVEAEDFFSYAGIWENRDVTVDDLRVKAWKQGEL